jgi:hypothetical protein
MSTYSLDTDTITKLLKKHPGNQPVIDRFRQEIQRNSLFVICPVVYYEMRRGLLFKGAYTACGFREARRIDGLEGVQCARLGPSFQPVVRTEGTRALP